MSEKWEKRVFIGLDIVIRLLVDWWRKRKGK